MTFSRSSENELHCKLNLPWKVRVALGHGCFDDGTEVRIVRIVGELLERKIERVQNIKRLGAKLHAHTLFDLSVLPDREIHLRRGVQTNASVAEWRLARRRRL